MTASASALVLVCGLVFAGVSTAGSGAPKGGIMNIQITTPPGRGATSPIVVVGAVGDYGTATGIDRDGKTDVDGQYLKVALTKGGFEINLTTLAHGGLASGGISNPTTCSNEGVFSGPVTVFDGDGSYKGITGTLHVTMTLATLQSRISHGSQKGECDQGGPPLKSLGNIGGSGRVSF